MDGRGGELVRKNSRAWEQSRCDMVHLTEDMGDVVGEPRQVIVIHRHGANV
jgi:hypothetical protein